MTKAVLKDSLLLAALSLAVVGCSDIDPGDESYCDLNPGVGECGIVGADDQWWCLNETPPPLPDPQAQPVAFVLPAVDWNTSAPLAGNGLAATLCGGIDPGCSQPLNAQLGLDTPFPALTAFMGMPLPTGAAGLGLPQGFRGVIQFEMRRDGRPEAEQYIITRYHMGGAAFVSRPDGIMRGAPILMLQRGLARETVERSFPLQGTPEQTLTLAALAFGVYDCNGGPVPGARIEIRQNGATPTGLLPFQLPASFIPVPFQQDAQLVTDVSGQVGYLNVPVGNVQLTAYANVAGQERLIGRTELGAVGNQFSVGVIRPPYFLDADVRGAPDPTNTVRGGG